MAAVVAFGAEAACGQLGEKTPNFKPAVVFDLPFIGNP